MSILTKVLAAAVGIQYAGVQDQSETNTIDGLNNAVFCGGFKRGPLNKPFAVTADNIRARLGYDPTNPDFMAVQDCLDLNVPKVYVQRFRAGFAELVGASGDFDDYTLPETTIGMTSAGVVSLSATLATLTIVYSMYDVMDEGCSLNVSFSQRAGASTVTGLADIVGLLVWKDATTGEELYRLSGLMGARGTDLTLAQAAEDSELFESFVVTRVSSTDVLVAASCLAGAAGNLPNTLGRNKVTLTIPAVAGAAETIPDAFYTDTANTLITGELRPDYLAIAQTSDLTLITTLMRVMDKLNIHLFGDLDPTLSIASVIAAAEAIEAKDHRVVWYWNPTESRPRDAVSARGARITRPCVGVQVGYRLLRNAGSDSRGVPPIHVPVAGFNFPLTTFKAMRPRADITLDEAALNQLAEAKINVVIQERLNSGTRFIFGDCLTQYDSETSALRVTNAAEIETLTANGVIEIIRRQLLTNTASFIERADTDCRQFLDACVTAGLLKPADDLGGFPYTISISARESRPFDAVDVEFKRRPEGAVRAAYLTTTINK